MAYGQIFDHPQPPPLHVTPIKLTIISHITKHHQGNTLMFLWLLVTAHQTSIKSLSSQHVDLDDACAHGGTPLTQSLFNPMLPRNKK